METTDGERIVEDRIQHPRGAIRGFLIRCEQGLPAAVQTSGDHCRIVGQIIDVSPGVGPTLVRRGGAGPDRRREATGHPLAAARAAE